MQNDGIEKNAKNPLKYPKNHVILQSHQGKNKKAQKIPLIFQLYPIYFREP